MNYKGTEKNTYAFCVALFLVINLVLLGLAAACSLETAAVKAESGVIREAAQELAEINSELAETNAELRDALVTLSGEYHKLWDTTHKEPAAWNDIGECLITHYCDCSECCGKSDGITASGTQAAEGRTVSVDTDLIPLGSEVLINGVVYIAEDTGVSGHHVDLYINSHEQAIQMGTYKTNVSWR